MEYKSVFNKELIDKEDKIKYLWNDIITSWIEITSVAYLRKYLANSPIGNYLGNDYSLFFRKYKFSKFAIDSDSMNNINIWNSIMPEFMGLNEEIVKNELDTIDLEFLEIIFNQLYFTVAEVNDNSRKADLYRNLPELIVDLVNMKELNFIDFQINHEGNVINFKKLINNQNKVILDHISNKKGSKIYELIQEYLLVMNTSDLRIKKRILSDLYIFIDGKQDSIKAEFTESIKNKVFSEMNNLEIRHNNKIAYYENGDDKYYKLHDKNGKLIYDISENDYLIKLDRLFQLVSMIIIFLNLT